LTSVKLNQEQQLILGRVENSAEHHLITGRAGTGKSTLLHSLVASNAKVMAVCAPTGVAAVAIGGQTIHSLLRIPVGIVGTRDLGYVNPEAFRVLSRIETLVIDEISMVSADLMDAIDQRLRQVRKKPEVPFGGIQIVMFGDPFQLSPVIAGEAERAFYQDHYRSPWFFDARVWTQTAMNVSELETVHRQSDAEFRSILDCLRLGSVTTEIGNRINELGMRKPEDPELITLASTNRSASKINAVSLDKLPGKKQIFRAIVEGDFGSGSTFPADQELALKPGAKVMFLRNDVGATGGPRFVNGTLGIVEQVSEELVINVDGQSIRVEPVSWEKVRYEYKAASKTLTQEVVAEFIQFPVRLAWAVTIHKAQGTTLESAIIDLGNRAFAPGQTYVAFSRLTSLDGLYLKRPLTPSDIFVDQDVLRFFAVQG